MRFWEVVSAFRDRKDILYQVFSGDRWGDEYLNAYLSYDELVDRQDRQVLDAPVPLELTREIVAQYPVTFDFDPKSHTIWRHPGGRYVEEGCVELTALEVHDRFGGAIIEEVFEYSSARVMDA